MTTTIEQSIANAIANKSRPDQLVDRYAELHANKNDIEAEMSVIKAQLEATGQPRIKGTFVTATIITSAPARRTDWKSVAAEMKPPAEIIALHTKTAEAGTTTLRLVAN